VRVCDNWTVLRRRTVLARDGVALHDVACRHGHGRGRETDRVRSHALIFVRRGCFVRSAATGDALLDPTVAYCVNPGEEERYDHPHHDGDDCTALSLEPDLLAALWGGEPTLPTQPLPTAPDVDVGHRLLLAAAGRGGDPHELVERALMLTARVLEGADRQRVAAGRPGSARRRRALVDSAREALAAAPERSLPELAQELAVSPHHLSRIFRSITGHTISRHRMRLRARAALERLAGGECDLAWLAADLGFADQSHLCRVLRDETGRAPSGWRRMLEPAAGATAAGSDHAKRPGRSLAHQ
jgi:AraC-like DNA-binding protein